MDPTIPTAAEIRAGLAAIVAEIAGEALPALPDDTPILDLVVSSLALVEGMRRIYERFGVLVSIRRVLEGQATLGGIAALIEQELLAPRAAARGVTAGAATPESAPMFKVPFAPSQRHVGFLVRYSSEAAAAFNEALAVGLEGPLDAPALQAALDGVVERYDALRTALSADSDELLVHEGARVPLLVSVGPATGRQEWLAESVRRPFSAGDRLFRAELLREAEGRHVLLLVSHALVADREALHVVVEEVASLHTTFSADHEPAPGRPALQWTDYLAMGGSPAFLQAREAAEAFWREELSRAAAPLALPGDFARPAVKRYLGDRLRLAVDDDVLARADQQARDAGVTTADLLLAAYTVFLARLCGQREVVVGVRSLPLYLEPGQRVVAQTRTMLPIRVSVDLQRTFGEHLGAVVTGVRQAQENRSVSLAEMIQLASLPRDQSRSPLFQAAFAHHEPGMLPAFGRLRTRPLEMPTCGARYDIDLALVTGEGRTELVCDFSAELLTRDTVGAWLRGLLALLENGVDQPGSSCGSLDMVGAADRETLLVHWNRPDREYAQDETVLGSFQRQVEEQPAAPAVRQRDVVWSYEELSQRVDALAERLSAAGVRRGGRVGVLVERSPDLVAALLAAWRAGAAYVPLDQRFPPKRLAYMLEDADVGACITTRALAEALPLSAAVRPVFVCLDEVERRPAAPLEGVRPAEAADSAYVIYTSGSTGQPKGVEIGHQALVNILQAVQERIGFEAGDVLLAVTTPTFDISTVELFLPLMAGGVVDVAPDDVIADGARLADLVETRRPDALQATPTTFKSMLAAGWRGNARLCLSSAGEALDRDLAERLLPACRELWNFYGPTEATVYVTGHRVESAPAAPMSVGRPIAAAQAYILDERRQPVPPGAVGELYLGGTPLARGYWRNPDLTAQRFVPHPFSNGERLYRTGDLARYLPDGRIVCLGRIDDQVKIHGVRVELGEVEAALRTAPGVEDAVVTAWRDGLGDAQLVAHVIARPGAASSAQEIRAHLREHLPETLVPPYVLFADAFPLTANGKIRRADLPAPTLAAMGVASRPADPVATATERALTAVWAGVLGIDASAVGRDSAFMDLGGHSLMLTPLMIEVRRAFQVGVTLREFFDAPTIRSFSRLIDERRLAASAGVQDAGQATAVRRREWGRERMAMLRREAQLPPNLNPARGLSYRPVERLDTVLLTGATGFLGAYVLAEILQSTSAHVHCLVRPRLGQSGRERIERQMRAYAVWRDDERWLEAWRTRMHVVEGDVTLSRLGMTDAAYEILARSVDAIVHGAAHVNFIYPYEALRATNVMGIHEIVRFAFHARIKPVHHLSTAAIWPMGAQFTFYEKDPIEHGELLNLGYDEAKWVGERCLLHAADRGLPVARYRPGEVGGDSVTGRCVTDHFLVATVKGFLQFGAFPALDMEVDVAPVDYIAKAMTHLVFCRNPIGRAFHLTNPKRLHMSEALAFMRQQGYAFEQMPFEQLRNRLLNRADFGHNALFAYQAVLEEMDDVSLQLPTYDTRETQRELQGSDIACPPADERLFGVYLDYLRAIGFMPQPESQGQPSAAAIEAAPARH